MNQISMNFPGKLVFGEGCTSDFITGFSGLPFKRIVMVSDPCLTTKAEMIRDEWGKSGIACLINATIAGEPGISDYLTVLGDAESFGAEAVVGIGGGSVLDVAKLVATLFNTGLPVESVFGNDKIGKRALYLACLPTTAGTGSEVSPNSILSCPGENMKKAVISPALIPDATYVDPLLTHSVPPDVTASTGIDALTHCIEAYANKNAHPMTDLYALEGIRLIFNHLGAAFRDGSDSEARKSVSLGSLYGGLCLGPVNTAAVHALAYPLGSRFHIPHGISNAMLLPHVLEFNLPAAVGRYASIARIIGVREDNDLYAAETGIRLITGLCREVEVPGKLSGYGVKPDDVPFLAGSALTVQRLLKNNLREIRENDALAIYNKLF